MKKLIILLIAWLVVAVTLGVTSDVTLEWDHSPSADVAGYNLYKSLQPFDPNVIPSGSPAETVSYPQHEVTIVVEDGTWYFVATAFDQNANESLPSNQVDATYDTEPPAPPQNLWIKWAQKIIAFIRHIFSFLA
jgi:hypothetical protein